MNSIDWRIAEMIMMVVMMMMRPKGNAAIMLDEHTFGKQFWCSKVRLFVRSFAYPKFRPPTKTPSIPFE